MLDMIATSTMYIGLNLTYASSFQMLRGSVIVFVAIFSMLFLQRKLLVREWIGIMFIIIGLGAVGASDILGSGTGQNTDRTDILIGDSLIILAQIITASQMVRSRKNLWISSKFQSIFRCLRNDSLQVWIYQRSR